MNDFYWGMVVTILAVAFLTYSSYLTIFTPKKWRKYKKEEKDRVFKELKESMIEGLNIHPSLVEDEIEGMTMKEARKRTKQIRKSLKKYKL